MKKEYVSWEQVNNGIIGLIILIIIVLILCQSYQYGYDDARIERYKHGYDDGLHDRINSLYGGK